MAADKVLPHGGKKNAAHRLEELDTSTSHQASLPKALQHPACMLARKSPASGPVHTDKSMNLAATAKACKPTDIHPYTTSSKLTGDMSSSLQGCAEQGTKISMLMTGIQSLSSLTVFQMLQHEETSPSCVWAKDWHSPIAVGASLTAKILPLNWQHLSSSSGYPAYLLRIWRLVAAIWTEAAKQIWLETKHRTKGRDSSSWATPKKVLKPSLFLPL